jgi:hypothetical protein
VSSKLGTVATVHQNRQASIDVNHSWMSKGKPNGNANKNNAALHKDEQLSSWMSMLGDSWLYL